MNYELVSLRFFFKTDFKNNRPKIPAINDETKIMILELSMCSLSEKARSVIKIDMVNPIPPKNPTPIMAFQLMSSGRLQTFNFTAK